MGRETSFIDILDYCLEQKKIAPPVFNRTGLQIQQEVMREEPDPRTIEQLITFDPALTSQILRIANSAFFKGLSKITTIRNAIVRLGMKEIANIALLASQKSNFTSRYRTIRAAMQSLWVHSVACAIGAQWIALNCGMRSRAQEAFTAGLLHDMGKLYILIITEALKRRGNIRQVPSETILHEALNSLHSRYGYELLSLWNLPEPYAVVARDHHLEEFDESNTLLVIVRLADMACNQQGIGLLADTDLILAATPEADCLGLSEIQMAELEIRLEDAVSLS